MIVLRILFKFIRLLRSETSPNSLAVALSLGMCLGLVPFLTPQGIVVLLVVLFFRVNLMTTLVSTALFWLLALALNAPLDAMGAGLLRIEGLRGLWSFLYNTPLLSLCFLNNSIALATTLLALLLFLPLFLLSRFLIRKVRVHVLERIARSKLVTFIKGFRIYRLYRQLVTPLW